MPGSARSPPAGGAGTARRTPRASRRRCTGRGRWRGGPPPRPPPQAPTPRETRRAPPPPVHPVAGPGPAADLFPVVRENRQRPARGPQFPQVRGDRRGRLEGDEIAQSLVDGKQGNPLAVALGPVGSVQLVALEAAHEKVAVVDEHVSHARIGQGRRPIPLPPPLREPHPPRVHSPAPPDRRPPPAHLLS